MSRSIITYDHGMQELHDMAQMRLTVAQPLPPPEDKYKDRLLKYIPGEVVALYVTLTGIAATAANAPHWLGWAIFAVGVVATWVYLRFALDVRDRLQQFISTLSFCIWVFALGGPFKDLAWYQPIFGALLLPVFTFFVAFIKPPPPQKPAPEQSRQASEQAHPR